MKKLVLLLITALFALSIAACGNGGNDANAGNSQASNEQQPSESSSAVKEDPSEPVELTYLAHVTPNYTREMYDQLAAKYHELNPNVTIKVINAPDTDINAYAKTLLASGSFPDVLQISNDDYVKAGALLPIDDKDPDIAKIKTFNYSDVDGKLYNLSPFIQPALLMYYNKTVFADAGITETPKTWDEFLSVCKQLKDKGYTPVELGGEWTTGFVYGEMISPSVFGDNQNWYADRFEGKVKYTDENFVKATSKFAELVKQGYINKGALSLVYNNMEAEFAKGKTGIYPMGAWAGASEVFAKANLDLGVFLPPTFDGKQYLAADVAGNWAISSKTKYPEEALKFLKWLTLDPENHKLLEQKDGLMSGLQEPIEYEGTPIQKEVFNLVKNADAVIGHFNSKLGKNAPQGNYDAYGKVAQDILLGKTDIKAELQTMDDTWDKNANK